MSHRTGRHVSFHRLHEADFWVRPWKMSARARTTAMQMCKMKRARIIFKFNSREKKLMEKNMCLCIWNPFQYKLFLNHNLKCLNCEKKYSTLCSASRYEIGDSGKKQWFTTFSPTRSLLLFLLTLFLHCLLNSSVIAREFSGAHVNWTSFKCCNCFPCSPFDFHLFS